MKIRTNYANNSENLIQSSLNSSLNTIEKVVLPNYQKLSLTKKQKPSSYRQYDIS